MSRHHGYIQPILVARGGSHEDTVVAAAVASVQAWLSAPEALSWDPWLGSAFAKTVRRARPVEIEKATPFLAARVEIGSAVAAAGAPFPTDGLPPEITKTQVTGTDFERTGSWPTPAEVGADECPVLVLNAGAGMSTGKCAAQAAHGLFGWALTISGDARSAWQADGCPVAIQEAEGEEWRALATKPPHQAVVIRDAGYTEIAPGTATVIAYQPGTAATSGRYTGWKRFISGDRRR